MTPAHRWTLTLFALLAALVAGLLSAVPASAAPPSAPPSCSAVPADGGYLVSWERPTSDTAVWRYVIRVKGQVDPTVRLDAGRGVENPTRSYLWTHPVADQSGPPTFMVRAKNADGTPGDWCEAVADGEAVVSAEPEPEPSVLTAQVAEPEPSDLTAQTAIRVFPHYANKTYGNHKAVLDTLGRLGVKRISAQLGPDMRADELAFYQAAHSRYGIKVWFAVGVPGDVLTNAEWASIRDLLTGPLADVAELASGWNEPNHRVSGDWAVPTAAHQNRLWDNIQQVNSQSGQDIAVGTPPLWSGSFDTQFADLDALAPKIAGSYDTINWHMYPHGKQGAQLEALIDRQVAEFTAAYGDLPMVNSESGYFTAENYTGGSNPSTEKEQAAQVDDLILFHAERGIGLSLFELLDDPDPTGTNREAHFGLIRTPSLDPSTWSDKPAYAVVRNLLTD